MQENKSQTSQPGGQIIIYQNEKGETKLDVRFQDETVWLTQKLMAELFQTSSQNITIHLKNIFEEGELDEESTCKDFLQVQIEGGREVNRKFKFYNLDAIISVGYLPNKAPFTLSTQQHFILSDSSIIEFEDYAKMLFEGVK